MGARRHFAEPHLIAFDKQLYAKQATTAQRFSHRFGDAFGLSQSNRAHGLWLPGFLVIALLLTMTDRRTESCATYVAHGEQGDFVIEVDEAFDDDPAFARTTAFLRVVPSLLHIVSAAQQALAFARRTHHRLDHTRETQVFDRFAVVLEGVSEVVRRGRQVQLFSGQAADAFAVHG